MYRPEEGTWVVLPKAQGVVFRIRDSVSAEEYAADRRALQEYLCGYFSLGNCTAEMGDAISPIAGDVPDGWKCFKVRWASPGCGKSGGIRLAVMVHCRDRIVRLAGAWHRVENPNADDFKGAFREA